MNYLIEFDEYKDFDKQRNDIFKKFIKDVQLQYIKSFILMGSLILFFLALTYLPVFFMKKTILKYYSDINEFRNDIEILKKSKLFFIMAEYNKKYENMSWDDDIYTNDDLNELTREYNKKIENEIKKALPPENSKKMMMLLHDDNDFVNKLEKIKDI